MRRAVGHLLPGRTFCVASGVFAASTLYPDLSIKEGYKVIGVIASLFRQEIPGYKAYQAAKAPDAEQWAEIIDLSSQANLKASQVKDILTGQIEIIKKLSQS